jgi:hypothetical protein
MPGWAGFRARHVPGTLAGVPGMSRDPDKAARQLAGLAQSNGILAERLERDGVTPYLREPDPPPAAPPVVVPTPAETRRAAATPGEIAGLPVQQPQEHHAPAPSPEPVHEPAGGGGPDPEPEPEPEPERRAGGGFLSGFFEGFASG